MVIFYSERINETQAILQNDEYRHCVKALRKKVGDEINFIDGKGGSYIGEITDISKKEVSLKIIQKEITTANENGLHIAIAPTKNLSRLEWFLEKSTELGIEEITPIICKHSERKVLKTVRGKKIILSATKQSKRLFLPKYNEPIKLKDFVKNLKLETQQVFVAHYKPSNQPLAKLIDLKKSCLVLIGPEGDFSEEEIKMIQEKGIASVNISNNRLRTETAGVMVSAIHDLVKTSNT